MTADVSFHAEPASLARKVATALERQLGVRPDTRAVIGVAGESGSGKSVTAIALVRELAARGFHPEILHQDDYFRLPPRVNHERRVRDLSHVGIGEVDFDRLARHVAAFRAAERDVEIPRVDYAGDRFDSRIADFRGCNVLVVEGTYVLLALADLNVRIFLEATHLDTRERRRARNRDVDAPIVDSVLAIEHAIIAPQVHRADMIIDRGFEPRVATIRRDGVTQDAGP